MSLKGNELDWLNRQIGNAVVPAAECFLEPCAGDRELGVASTLRAQLGVVDRSLESDLQKNLKGRDQALKFQRRIVIAALMRAEDIAQFGEKAPRNTVLRNTAGTISVYRVG